MNKILHVLFLIFIAFVTTDCIANDAKSDLQSILDQALESKNATDDHITGIPLTFQCSGFNNNSPVSLATGKINDKSDTTLPVDAMYQIGSETKSFTAVVTLQLENEGVFGSKGLDSTVGEILGNQVYPNWNNIKLRQLLNMTSGIPEYTGIVGLQYANNPYHKFTTGELLSLVYNKPLDFTAGTNWKYSNTGYVLINKIITQLSGISLKEQITNRIINKLNLAHTYYVENIPENEITRGEQIPLLMSGYYDGSNAVLKTKYLYPGVDIKSYSLSFANSAGAIISNTSDLHTYLKALFTVGILLNENELKELTSFVSVADTTEYKAGQPINGDVDKSTQMAYGLGIFEGYFELPFSGQKMIMYQHEGGTAGFTSLWGYQKNGDMLFTFTTNSTSGNNTSGALFNNLLEVVSKDCQIK